MAYEKSESPETEKGDKTDDADLLKTAREQYKEAEECWRENRRQWLEDVKFARLAEQWPEEVKAERKDRPCLTINRLPSFIRQVINDARQNKPAIKVRPADSGSDPQTAEVINDLIRNIEYTSSADSVYDTALDCSVTGGFGFFRIKTDYAHNDTFDLDLLIEAIANPLTVLGDPRSKAIDSSDWNVAFVSELIPKKEFESRYKDAKKVNWDGDGYDEVGSEWMTEDDVRVCEYWTREEVTKQVLKLSTGEVIPEDHYTEHRELFDMNGATIIDKRAVKSWKVTQRIITGCEVLETIDWPGRYIPIIPVYGDEVNVEGVRHFRSMIRDAKDPQRMFNYWRTTATELVALAPRAPWVGRKGTFNSDPKWATANTQSHQYLEYDTEAPRREPFAGVPAGALQEALNASDDMKAIMGIYDAALGARSNETSGRAIMARKQESDVSTFHFIDNLARGITHGGRVLIDLIPFVYTGPRIIRVLGRDNAEPRNVPVNQPVQMGPQGPQPIQGPIDPAIPTAIFDLTAGRYDLTVDVGPSFQTKRQEAAEQMTSFIEKFPPAAPLLGDLIAKNGDWPESDEVAKRLKTLLPPEVQGENPQLQEMQGQMQAIQQELQKLQMENAALKQDKSIEAQKVKIDGFNAETNRLKAIADINRPPPQRPPPQGPQPVQ